MNAQLQRLMQAAQSLLDSVHVATDCMSNQIKRERIDDALDALEEVILEIRRAGKIDQENRPEVLAFAQLMEQRLRQKDAEKGQSWKDDDIDNLRINATAKVYLIENAIHAGAHRAAAHMAIDLGNFAMMIADVGGALTCGRKNNGIPCTMPAGSECPDCGRSLIDYHGE